jgi:copper chaperone
MKELKFKTNINCNGCLSKVSPQLNNESGIEEWAVDLNAVEKTLTVQSSTASKKMIMNAVQKVGFKIESLD